MLCQRVTRKHIAFNPKEPHWWHSKWPTIAFYQPNAQRMTYDITQKHQTSLTKDKFTKIYNNKTDGYTLNPTQFSVTKHGRSSILKEWNLPKQHTSNQLDTMMIPTWEQVNQNKPIQNISLLFHKRHTPPNTTNTTPQSNSLESVRETADTKLEHRIHKMYTVNRTNPHISSQTHKMRNKYYHTSKHDT